MSKSFKVAALIAATALILAAPVFGQTSNMSTATAGVFTNDVDDSMDVHNYSDVEFDKWFGFIGYGTYDEYNGIQRPLQLGYATRFGDLYLGTYFTGNVLQSKENWNETVTTTYDLPNQIKDNTETTTVYPNYIGGDNPNVIRSNNSLDVLIGVAGMGFKVGFSEYVTELTFPLNRTVTITETNDGTVTHTTGDILEYSNISGTLIPSLTWGMKIDLGSVAIRPKVEASVIFGLYNSVNNFRPVPYTTIDGEINGQDRINYNGNNNDYVQPDIKVGLGIDFEKFSLDVGYGIGFPIYDNSYDVSGFSGSTAGTVSWNNSYTETNSSIADTQTTNYATLSFNEYSNFLLHTINIGFSTDKEVADGLRLGLNAGAEVGITTYAYEYYTLTLNKSETVNNNTALSSQNTRTETENRSFGTNYDVTTFSITPVVNIGASYVLFPGRFTINAGVRLNPLGYTNTVTRTSSQAGYVTKTKTYNSNGDLLTDTVDVTNGAAITDSVDVNDTLSYLSAGLFGGFLFNFTDTLALDTVFGSGNINSTFNMNTTTLRVLFSVKF